MDVASVIAPGSVRCAKSFRGKKHALDFLSQILAETSEGLSAGEILEGFVARERLGSTALGRAVAMPHTRLAGIEKSVGAFLKIEEPVNFDAEDGEQVDLLFGLLVPEACTNGEIKEMRELIQRLRDPVLQQELRAADDPQELYDLLTDSLTIIRQRIRA